MSRSERLLQLMQILRRYRYPVSGAALAQELGISLRSVYRDIASLQAQGARIEGEAGLGYVLQPGFTLPPLMFSSEEAEAIALGLRWVTGRADQRLSASARDALAKITAVLPPELRHELDHTGLLIGPSASSPGNPEWLHAVRLAVRQERILSIHYADERGNTSERRIWPCALTFFDHAQVIVAWCELRQSFRHFRTDRLHALNDTGERYPQSRQKLLKRWKEELLASDSRNTSTVTADKN
ncbi:helix-turn-helix transcriptional regulator [Undibacterium griseum]|uniref:YafY family transcriptional regulator n=1 Tax=Undibacterium griseum TaxID=2762295 RepID=A0ABR6YK19_9BURK|nr:YafY family protein [Undibacterium griseum]MBC3884247.1 YafY family transcriptional regulator [Undibacterium griseum]